MSKQPNNNHDSFSIPSLIRSAFSIASMRVF